MGRLPRASIGPGPTTYGPAGRALRVEGRADGPATSLPPIMPPSAASSGGGKRGGVAGRGRGLQGGEDPKTAEEGVAGREVLLISLWSFLLRRESFRMPQGRVARTRRRLPACVRLELNFPGKAPSVRGRRGKVLAAAPHLRDMTTGCFFLDFSDSPSEVFVCVFFLLPPRVCGSLPCPDGHSPRSLPTLTARPHPPSWLQ